MKALQQHSARSATAKASNQLQLQDMQCTTTATQTPLAAVAAANALFALSAFHWTAW
jgi:hypothetical protein